MTENVESRPEERTPVLVVSGFLGAGKTTLVRHLLKDAQRQGLRLAVVSNEFGALGIDRAILGSDAAYVELEGGCVCCQLSNELVDTLQMLRDRVRPDRIVIETSGLALPYDTQLNLWREPVSHWVGDDLAVVVVDAEQVLQRRDLAGTFEHQVTSADLLLLNKVDLVPHAEIDAVESALRTLEPETPILHTVHTQIDPTVLFVPFPSRARKQLVAEPALSSHDHQRFEAREIVFPEVADPRAIMDGVRKLAAVRVKGFVRSTEGIRLVQGVGPRVHLTKVDIAPADDLVGRLVAIFRRPVHSSQ